MLLTSQYLDDADRLAQKIIVIDTGKVIANGTSDELKDQIGGDRLSVTIARSANLQLAVDALGPLDDVFLTLTGKHAAAADGSDSEDAA